MQLKSYVHVLRSRRVSKGVDKYSGSDRLQNKYTVEPITCEKYDRTERKRNQGASTKIAVLPQ